MKAILASGLAWIAGLGLLACGPSPSTPSAPSPVRSASASPAASVSNAAPPIASVEIKDAGGPALVVQRDRVFSVRGLAVDPSGSMLAVAGRTLSIRRHEGADWPLVAVYAFGGDHLVGAPSWSPDGRWLAVATGKRAVAVEIATGALKDVPLPPGDLLGGDVAWRPQGDATLALPTDGGIALWSPGAPPRAPLDAAASFSHLFWSPDGRSIVGTTAKGNALVNAETGEAHLDPLLGASAILGWSADGKTLASEEVRPVYETASPGGRPHMPSQAGMERLVELFEIGKARSGTTLKASGRIEAFGPGGKAFLSADRTSPDPGAPLRLDLTDVGTRATRPLLTQKGISAAAWTPGGEVILGFDDGSLRIADVAGGQARAMIDAERDDLFSRPRWTPDALVTTAGRDGKRAVAFDLATGAARTATTLDAPAKPGPSRSPDGKTTATLAGSSLTLRDVATGKTVATLAGASSRFAWTPDSKAIISADAHRIFVWDATNGERTRVFYGADEWVDFAVAPRGTLLAHTAFTGTTPRQLVVSVVDWATGAERASIPVPVFLEDPMLAWSPSGDVLAIGGPDVLLHRIADGATLHLATFGDATGDVGLAWIDSGAFDGDEAAFAHLFVRQGPDLARAPLSRDAAILGRFRHPRLVADFLAGKPLTPP